MFGYGAQNVNSRLNSIEERLFKIEVRLANMEQEMMRLKIETTRENALNEEFRQTVKVMSGLLRSNYEELYKLSKSASSSFEKKEEFCITYT